MAAVVIGWDFVAAFKVAEALGYCPTTLAEFLPELEAVAVKSMNIRNKGADQS